MRFFISSLLLLLFALSIYAGASPQANLNPLSVNYLWSNPSPNTQYDLTLKFTLQLPAEENADRLHIIYNSANFPSGTEIPFWRDDKSHNKTRNSWTVYARIPSIPPGKDSARMTVLNDAGSDKSDGASTFEFFEDFESGNLDRWEIKTNGNPKYGVSRNVSANGAYSQYCGPSSCQSECLRTQELLMNLTDSFTTPISTHELSYWRYETADFGGTRDFFVNGQPVFSDCGGCNHGNPGWYQASFDYNGSISKIGIRETDITSSNVIYFDSFKARNTGQPEPTYELCNGSCAAILPNGTINTTNSSNSSKPVQCALDDDCKDPFLYCLIGQCKSKPGFCVPPYEAFPSDCDYSWQVCTSRRCVPQFGHCQSALECSYGQLCNISTHRCAGSQNNLTQDGSLLSLISGKVYFLDKWNALTSSPRSSYLDLPTMRGLPYVHYHFTYASKVYDGYTDADGRYSIRFDPPLNLSQTQNAEFKVILEDKDNMLSVSIQDATTFAHEFALFSDNGTMAYDVGPDFGLNTTDIYPKAAKVYCNIWQAKEYAQEVLKQPMQKSKPLAVEISPGTPTQTLSMLGHSVIGINESYADLMRFESPVNAEWHEYGHAVMFDGFSDFPNEGKNHDGFANPTSTDSLVEGWAMAYGALVNHQGREYNLYPTGSYTTNLEVNIKAVGPDSRYDDREEFVVASLLWDFMDGKNSADHDHVEIPPAEFWAFFKRNDFKFSDGRAGNIHSVADLYEALNSTDMWNLHGDDDNDGIDNLDEIFIAHGIYADSNSNERYDLGERVGFTLKTDGNHSTLRRNIPPMSNTGLGIDVRSDTGERIASVAKVSVKFPSPYEFYDYEYEVPLEAGESQIGMLLPTPEYGANATMGMLAAGYAPSASNYTISSESFWQKLSTANGTSANGTFDSHSFVLSYVGGEDCAQNSDCKEGAICTQNKCVKQQGIGALAGLLAVSCMAIGLVAAIIVYLAKRRHDAKSGIDVPGSASETNELAAEKETAAQLGSDALVKQKKTSRAKFRRSK